MINLTDKTLAQIVTDNHHAAAIFEKYGLDFCCKGKRSLQYACSEKQVTIDDVLNDLESINNEQETSKNFTEMSLTQLSRYIVLTHHAYINFNMPQIFSYLQKIATKHGERHPELIELFENFTLLRHELTEHMNKEEKIAFPLIRNMEMKGIVPESKEQVDMLFTSMEDEHEGAGNLIEKIRVLTSNYTPPADACTTYRVAFAALESFAIDLHRHVHLENYILFPRAIELYHKIKNPVANWSNKKVFYN